MGKVFVVTIWTTWFLEGILGSFKNLNLVNLVSEVLLNILGDEDGNSKTEDHYEKLDLSDDLYGILKVKRKI